MLSVDWHRTRGHEHKRTNCRCAATGAYIGGTGDTFPHRRGSLYCEHYIGDPGALKHGKMGHRFRDESPGLIMREPGED